jgi:hypothetical protein
VSGPRSPKERSGLKKSRFTDEQIIGLLVPVEAVAGWGGAGVGGHNRTLVVRSDGALAYHAKS